MREAAADGIDQVVVKVPQPTSQELRHAVAKKLYHAADYAAREQCVVPLIEAFQFIRGIGAPTSRALDLTVTRILHERLNDPSEENVELLSGMLHYLGFVDKRVPRCVEVCVGRMVDTARRAYWSSAPGAHRLANELHTQLSVLNLLGYKTGKFLDRYKRQPKL